MVHMPHFFQFNLLVQYVHLVIRWGHLLLVFHRFRATLLLVQPVDTDSDSHSPSNECHDWSVLKIAAMVNPLYTEFHFLELFLWIPLPRPLVSKLTMVRALRRVNTSPDWKLSIVPEMELPEWFPWEKYIAWPVLTKPFLQPAKTAIMCTACYHDYACPPPTLSHLFC